MMRKLNLKKVCRTFKHIMTSSAHLEKLIRFRFHVDFNSTFRLHISE